MNNELYTNGLRFLGLLLLQTLVLRGLSLSFSNGHVLLYPVFILLLPLRTPRPLVIFLGFLMGLSVDVFYDSPGVHASASVFTAFIRPFILSILEPRGGYNSNYSPTKQRMGIAWFLQYSSILIFAHLFYYFSVEAFTFAYIVSILANTFISFFVTMIFVLMYQFIFNPED